VGICQRKTKGKLWFTRPHRRDVVPVTLLHLSVLQRRLLPVLRSHALNLRLRWWTSKERHVQCQPIGVTIDATSCKLIGVTIDATSCKLIGVTFDNDV
jgi:hypothetical protein